jgi:hypothetical protein
MVFSLRTRVWRLKNARAAQNVLLLEVVRCGLILAVFPTKPQVKSREPAAS